MNRALRVMVLALALPALLDACGSDTETPSDDGVDGEVTVYAASSLTEAFAEIGAEFEERYDGVNVVLNFAGSTTLRTQIEQGAPADVFASANQPQMDLAVEAGVIDGEPQDFATNRLVVITPAGRDTVRTLGDLANDGIKLVLALPDVPVGNYARQAIEKMGSSGKFDVGFATAVLANVVSEESNVRQVVAKVALGEADAGFVYGTDITSDIAGDVHTIEIPDEFNVVASYPIAKVEGAPNPNGADTFIDFVLSAEGQAILDDRGFGGPAE